jgi:hypothetical protein
MRPKLWRTAVRMALAAPARALEIAADEMTLGLHMTDHGMAELAFDGAENAF